MVGGTPQTTTEIPEMNLTDRESIEARDDHRLFRSKRSRKSLERPEQFDVIIAAQVSDEIQKMDN
jgi:hypothetical protein